ncbi:hypothetical protein L53_06900 [Hyphomonas sp. L-53-1-40]|nr:hypothetical protein L53_06900 [Hyphomonas sp. L-53-1-40]
MRIIAGEHKGRAIAAPKGQGTRPTGDRARESIFNMLAHADWAPEIDGARVIDLFAGSGALGLEAMSRGAAFCLFVETDHGARGAIRDNIEALGLFGNTRLHRRGPAPAPPSRSPSSTRLTIKASLNPHWPVWYLANGWPKMRLPWSRPDRTKRSRQTDGRRSRRATMAQRGYGS